MTNKNIHFIFTGGTIDSVFSPELDTVIVNDHSVVLDYLNTQVRPNIEITSETLTLKDSRDITDNIRKEMLNSIEKASASSIVITHGTYTMPDTARYLEQHGNIAGGGKTVILTGSMLPLKGFSDSDAPFNLGYAISASQLLEPGVYLAMNSHIFTPDNVEKDVSKAIFVEK